MNDKLDTLSKTENLMDVLEMGLLETFPVVDVPVVHKFTPGLYMREMVAVKGTTITSKIHKTEHPYVVLEGRLIVCVPEERVQYLEIGDSGVTKPNTRRAMYIEEDCRWVTYHVLSPEEEEFRKSGGNEDALLAMIEERIIEKRNVPGLEDFTINELYKALLKDQEQEAPCLG